MKSQLIGRLLRRLHNYEEKRLTFENASILLANKMLIERDAAHIKRIRELEFWNEALQRALDTADTWRP